MDNVGAAGIPDNQAFLVFLFGTVWGDAHVCAFPGDPGTTTGGWRGGRARNTLFCDRDANNYFCVSAFSGHRRLKDDFRYLRVLVFDDVLDPDYPGDISSTSAKVLMSRVRAITPNMPSYIIETSPFNYQVGFALRPIIEDRAHAEILINGFIAQGLCATGDPGQSGVTRYVRLPYGRNLKRLPDGALKYPGNDGRGFQTRLVLP